VAILTRCNLRLRTRLTPIAAAILIVACLFAPNLSPSIDREHQVKTGFIFSIAKFCDWETPKSANSRFIVGIYRTKAFDGDIDVLNGKTIQGRTVQVVQIRSESEIANCQVVVVGDIGAEAIRHCVNLCRNSGTLLVGESEGFARDGGTVGFVLKEGTVRFQVNLQTAQLDRVALSAKLLILAEQAFR